MSLALYGHPFSSYTQKVLIALYENQTPFEFRCIRPETPEITHVMTPVQHAVGAAMTGDPVKRHEGLAHAEQKLEMAYAWLEGQLVDEARYFRPFFPLGAPDRD